MPKITARDLTERAWRLLRQNTEELGNLVTVSIWLRWLYLGACLFETNYRVEFNSQSHILNTTYLIFLMVPNAYVHWKSRRGDKISLGWLITLSAIDVVALTFSISLSGGFDSRYFVMYYIIVSGFALIFTSPYLVLIWTTMLALVYVSICLAVGDGIAFVLHEEKELYYRLIALYAVAMSVNMVTWFERRRRIASARRERELNRQRIALSQTMHDTTAQSAYTLGLGLEEAIEMADDDPELVRKLEAMWEVCRSTMWMLRHPIDGGSLFSGGKLSETLNDHVATFSAITSIPGKLVLRGTEPELSAISRSLLFSIAHNALTNALRHAGAESVTVTLDYDSESLRMSIFDDGSGLPVDYAERGYGFKNMTADAERMGGRLEAGSDSNGTTIVCSIPYEQNLGGR